MNRSSMMDKEFAATFELIRAEKRALDLPEISTVYISGALAFKTELKNELFPFFLRDLSFCQLLFPMSHGYY